MTLSKEEKEAIAVRIAPYLKSAVDPDTWHKVFNAALETGVTFEEAVQAADNWLANKTAEFNTLSILPSANSESSE